MCVAISLDCGLAVNSVLLSKFYEGRNSESRFKVPKPKPTCECEAVKFTWPDLTPSIVVIVERFHILLTPFWSTIHCT